ncbi:hypothetical protein [Arenibaculum sp.]|uniref:hypothetical protein n=1 Tax=Arenibaculum sp. TaxID=2865862 RepID=UPI002E161AB5|nr:hypothetical protein [Arenibaculum sp.]
MRIGRIVHVDEEARAGRLVCREDAREFPFDVESVQIDDLDHLDTGAEFHFQVLTSDLGGARAVCLRRAA